MAGCSTYQPKGKTAERTSHAAYCHSTMPFASKSKRDEHLESLLAVTRSLCVVSDQNHFMVLWASKKAESHKDNVTLMKKAAFAGAGLLLTQTPSAYLLF